VAAGRAAPSRQAGTTPESYRRAVCGVNDAPPRATARPGGAFAIPLGFRPALAPVPRVR